MMVEKEQITGIVIAGGLSSRMHADKGNLSFNGLTFIEHIFEAMDQLVGEKILVSDHPEHQDYPVKIVADEIKNQGPLAAIYSGLKVSQTEVNLILSCDIPLITQKLLEPILQFEKGFEAIIYVMDQQNQPLIGAYKKSIIPKIEEQMKRNRWSLRDLISKLKVKYIEVDECDATLLKNYNYPIDYKKLQSGN